MRNKLKVLLLLLTFGVTQLYAQSNSTPVEPNASMADYNNPKLYILNNITLSGVEYADKNLFISTSGLNKGDSVYMPSNYISQAIQRLWSQRYFSDVKIEAETSGDSLDLHIIVKERQKVYNWLFDGAKKGEQTELLESLKLRRGSELSDYIVEKSKNAIQKYYKEKGFRNAKVTTRIKQDTTIQNAVNVTFVIDKKSKVKIGEIAFEGNDVFSDERLGRALKKTHKKGWKFWQSAKLKEADFEEDKENLIDFYNSKGYRNATIISDSIYDKNEKRMGIKLNVHEGNKYYFRNITWVGNSKYETAVLEQMLGLRSGDQYDKKTMYKRLGVGKEDNPEDMSIKSLYQNDGYLFFQIDPSEIIIGEDSIDLEVKIFEGKQATINEVNITGNMRVNDEVIRREIDTRPGELYNRSLLMSTIRLLGQMQHFNPETIQPGINPVSNELVDISWPLEETASDKFEVSGGFGGNMFVGSIGVQLNNLSVRNAFKKDSWRPYPQGQNQQLSIRGNSNGTFYKSFSLGFTEPWFGGKKPNSLSINTFFSDENGAYMFYQKSDKHFRTFGASIGIGRRLSWPDHFFTLYNEIGYQAYNLQNWEGFLVNNGTSNQLTLKTVFGRSSVDQPIYPRTGSDFSISMSLTPPYSLFDGKDYSNQDMSRNDRYKLIEFHKWNFKSQWYLPLNQGEKTFVLMAKAEMGYLGAYNKHKKSPFEGFDVGGSGMSGYNVYGVDIVGLRGYEDGSITPNAGNQANQARVYNKYTVEMRYPFILKPSSTIYGIVFAEGGNAYQSWEKFNPFLLKRSLGVGVRLYLPIVGMLGFDWGYGFDNQYGENKRHGGQLHFMMGAQF